MSYLKTSRNLTEADEAYAALIEAHQGLSDEQSHAFNARLILTLFNHIGDLGVIRQALAVAAPDQEKEPGAN
ncbi:DUF2783 domain-containing protein [Mesorhizobium sp. CO1-1-8]|uniref:DUF2783 domain-containing protein n=1 Tax=Mesorhizobium sp. CO1-1-8 TaxID=2876631 RepID=UPI001CD16C94|nr:DUF2783 domain-containing protein [Mesorhizobium sp. CO1-1-8]MBZ9772396.1 DUF2783 domain-containing protein [Mesorhizobium sp. CO1-1-8]